MGNSLDCLSLGISFIRFLLLIRLILFFYVVVIVFLRLFRRLFLEVLGALEHRVVVPHLRVALVDSQEILEPQFNTVIIGY